MTQGYFRSFSTIKKGTLFIGLFCLTVFQINHLKAKVIVIIVLSCVHTLKQFADIFITDFVKGL